MANFDIELDPNTLTSIRALIVAMEGTFQVDFVPGFLRTLDQTLPIDSATFKVNTEKQHYEVGVQFGVKVGEDDEGDAKYLGIGINIAIKPDKLTGGKRPAEYGGLVEVPLSGGGITSLVFEGQFTAKAGDMWILQCTMVEEQSIPLHAIFGGVAPGVGAIIPEDFDIPLQQSLTLVITGRAGSARRARIILGVAFHTNIDMGQLPLVGINFKSDQTSAGLTLAFMAATYPFTHKEIKALDSVTEELATPFRFRSSSSLKQDLERGAYLVGYVNIGELKRSWYTPIRRRRGGVRSIGSSEIQQVPRAGVDDSPITLGDNGAWISVERSVGSVHLNKLGLIYKDGAAHLAPDLVVSLGELRLSLIGAAIRLPIPKGDLGFNVEGFGLEYENDSLHVRGAFLRAQRGEYEEYVGLASLQLSPGKKGKGVGLSAIGAYAHASGDQPSLFLYAALNAPLGGPPFFFVMGLAGGFGYNRSLRAPALEDVSSFPLVGQAVQGTGDWSSDESSSVIQDQLRQLAHYIPIQRDSGFLALGVKFTTCKLVDGFALATFAFGRTFELGLLGLARFQVPPKVSRAVVVVEIALQARFAPAEGLALIQGQLTSSSYILDPSCALTGGFAFATWFAGPHAGDFVFTLGGYHPRFSAPQHYPRVPRLGFDWRVGSVLSLRGESYFALCGHAVMAGGSLEAKFESGAAWASFRMGADFLICWKPYCYDIQIYLHFKFGLGSLSASLGASLRIWGPEFGGYAKLKVFLFSVKVKFGNQDSFAPKPISWEDFRDSFLPAGDEVCSIAVAGGLMKEVRPENGETIWVVNPIQCVLTTDSLIPNKEVHTPHMDAPLQGNPFGVAPVAVEPDDVKSTQTITLTHNGQPVKEGMFRFTPILRSMPAAMWAKPRVEGSGNSQRLKFPDVNNKALVTDLLVGARIEPAQPPKGGNTDTLPVSALRFDPDISKSVYDFPPLPEFRAIPGDDEARRDAIEQTLFSHSARDALLEELGFDSAQDVALNANLVETFVIAPQVKNIAA
ncbi:DUF6603 domain-containing protein [Vitiosangium sp. GDMCC 1.1324]|uniref:DUF6603 domain-containing protein n=1 Tax=Vitiosangium sp. (strain GDMCC 1.1324) TaxID=2138576 RepID=UPI000D3C4206|nr:DUF6603 domain-containing protein [Vitiosangium sp. GDMCC 1.1324]PTL81142.1 transcriptional regulator [Vitiosangium sp. GDMCC 1.1324]